LKRSSTISFQNSFFYLGWPDDESLSANPDLTAVLKTRRRQKFHPPKQRSKAGEGALCMVGLEIEIFAFLILLHTAKKIRFMYSQKKKLRELIPNFYIHISVSDLYFPTIGPAGYIFSCSQIGRPLVGIYK
jgi:hypothetical protein